MHNLVQQLQASGTQRTVSESRRIDVSIYSGDFPSAVRGGGARLQDRRLAFSFLPLSCSVTSGNLLRSL